MAQDPHVARAFLLWRTVSAKSTIALQDRPALNCFVDALENAVSHAFPLGTGVVAAIVLGHLDGPYVPAPTTSGLFAD